MVNPLLTKDLKESSWNLCNRVAGSHEIVTACFYGPRVCGYADETSDANILLVLREHRPRLKGYFQSLNGTKAFILAADQKTFEGDVEQGQLGEFIAEKITTPYEPIMNEEYLWSQEVRLKRRIVREFLENIVSEFPELCHELLIGAEYFLFEDIMRRARLFLPITYGYLNMLQENLRQKNMEIMMRGYLAALNQLAEEGWVTFSNEYVKITPSLVDATRKRKLRVPYFLRSIRKAIFLNVLSLFPKMMRPFTLDQEMFMKARPGIRADELVFRLEDPKKHLFVPTPLGLVTLSDKITIEDFVRKAVPGGKVSEMKIKDLGGVLNAVYLLTFQKGQTERKVVVKKYKDWYGFKWFPLALWALGTRGFSILGSSRLQKEYAINQFLRSQGFPVPKILYVSLRERLIFEDFIQGESLVEIVKRVLSTKRATAEEAFLIREAGKGIAAAHRLGVAIGDCKPENLIVAKDGKVYFVDLEQATRDGNQAWDIAEFLYYSGHYASFISSAGAAELIAREFIQGYLEAGGRAETLRKAGSVRYAKVFSIFTPPHVILVISDLCKRMGKQ